MKSITTNNRVVRPTHLGSLLRMGFAVMCLGCASYSGTARRADPGVEARDGKWWMVPSFPLVRQDSSSDCGAAVLAAVMRYWGYSTSPQEIEAEIGNQNSRLQAGDMVAYARKKGLHSYVFYGTMTDIVHEIRQGRPVIVGLGKALQKDKALSHYEVVVGYEPEKKLVLLLDPGRGWQLDTVRGFGEEWARSKGVTIVAFLPATS